MSEGCRANRTWGARGRGCGSGDGSRAYGERAALFGGHRQPAVRPGGCYEAREEELRWLSRDVHVPRESRHSRSAEAVSRPAA